MIKDYCKKTGQLKEILISIHTNPSAEGLEKNLRKLADILYIIPDSLELRIKICDT